MISFPLLEIFRTTLVRGYWALMSDTWHRINEFCYDNGGKVNKHSWLCVNITSPPHPISDKWSRDDTEAEQCWVGLWRQHDLRQAVTLILSPHSPLYFGCIQLSFISRFVVMMDRLSWPGCGLSSQSYQEPENQKSQVSVQWDWLSWK